MPSYFTQYWKNEQWGFDDVNWIWVNPNSQLAKSLSKRGAVLDHAAGNMFSRAGVATGG